MTFIAAMGEQTACLLPLVRLACFCMAMHVLLVDPDALLVSLYLVALLVWFFFHAVVMWGHFTRQAVRNSRLLLSILLGNTTHTACMLYNKDPFMHPDRLFTLFALKWKLEQSHACACKAAAAYSGSGPTLSICTLHHRFPIGGDTMSVTSGVVSRIEVTSYVHGAAELLAIQIDAAINSGNSGGPAFNSKGECVGIAFQSLKVCNQALTKENKLQQHVWCLTTSRLLRLVADAITGLVH